MKHAVGYKLKVTAYYAGVRILWDILQCNIMLEKYDLDVKFEYI